ncbi:hypothetical protein D3C72_2126660 [compost metagenome]
MIGVTCRITAIGNRPISTHLNSAKAIASSTPPTMAAPSASSVSFTVNHSAPESEPQLSNSVRRMSEGAGRM